MERSNVSAPAGLENSAVEVVDSEWFGQLAERILLGHHVILHGNVADDVLLNGQCVTVAEGLTLLLKTLGYSLIARYDAAEGLRPADDESRVQWRELGLPLDAPPGSSPGAPADQPNTSDEALPGRQPVARPGENAAAARQRLLDAASRSVQPSSTNPEMAVVQIEQLLTQTSKAVAIWLDGAEMLIRDPSGGDHLERRLLMRLKQALRQATVAPFTSGVPARNSAILLTPDLDNLPAWFYRSEPSIATIQITPPGLEERQALLARTLERFWGGDHIARADQPRLVDTLARLTDAFTLHQIKGSSISVQ